METTRKAAVEDGGHEERFGLKKGEVRSEKNKRDSHDNIDE